MTDLSRLLFGFCGFFFLIVLPLVSYLKRRCPTIKQILLYFFLCYLLWYLPYAPIHEGAHFVAGWLTGMQAKSYQLLPHFWRGDFVNGYIDWADGEHWQNIAKLPGSISTRRLVFAARVLFVPEEA